MDSDRITELEIRFSHQDDFIQQLNQIVVQHQKTIERLEKEVLDLKQALNSQEGVSGQRSLADDRPPHY